MHLLTLYLSLVSLFRLDLQVLLYMTDKQVVSKSSSIDSHQNEQP